MPSYDARCEHCEVVLTYTSTYEEREKTPSCPDCGEEMERVWVGGSAWVSPESMWTESRHFKGMKAKINDSGDNPWEGTGTGFTIDQSKDFYHKTRERMGIKYKPKKLIFT